MASALAEKLFRFSRNRLGQKLPSSNPSDRFRHRQVDIWTRAFEQADRNGRIAWLLGALLLLSLALNIVQQGRPANTIFVDQLGNAKYFPELASPEPARDYEAENFSKSWVRDFLSRDPSTATKDVVSALNLTEPGLRARLKAQLLDSGEIEKARNANLNTAVEVEEAKTTHMGDDRMQVELKGQRLFSTVGNNKKTLAEPFTISLILGGVARSQTTPNGLMVWHVGGTFADNRPFGDPAPDSK